MCKWSREEGAGMEVGAGHFMKEVAEDQHLKKWENVKQKYHLEDRITKEKLRFEMNP